MKQIVTISYTVLLCSLILTIHAGKCIVYKEDLFFKSKYPLNTELRCYLYFKNNPPQGGVTYVAAPWEQLISKNSYKDAAKQIRVRNGITVCFHTQFEKIIPLLKKIGITVLFTPHVDTTKQYPITVLSIAHSPVNVSEPAEHKDILYSFIGTPGTHKIRKKIFQLPKKDDTYLVARKKHHFNNKESVQEREREEYLEINARSRFGLCPRGYGPGTIRFWELLRSGTIPVVLNDVLMLPENFDWDSTIIQIPEANIKRVDTIIRSIDESTETIMRANCLMAYEQYCEDNIVRPILNYMHESAPSV